MCFFSNTNGGESAMMSHMGALTCLLLAAVSFAETASAQQILNGFFSSNKCDIGPAYWCEDVAKVRTRNAHSLCGTWVREGEVLRVIRYRILQVMQCEVQVKL